MQKVGYNRCYVTEKRKNNKKRWNEQNLKSAPPSSSHQSLKLLLDSSQLPSGACLNSWCTPRLSGTHFVKPPRFSNGWAHFKDKAGTPVLRDVPLLCHCTGAKSSWPSVWTRGVVQILSVIHASIKVKPNHNNNLPNYQPCHPEVSISRNPSYLKLCKFLLAYVLPQQVIKRCPKRWGCTSLCPVFVPLVSRANLSLMTTPKLLLANGILQGSKVIIPSWCIVC